jgi:hypothetical protein
MKGDNDFLWHQSGINPKGEPFVQLIRGETVIAQMSAEQARDHARAILESAEAAEQDAFMVAWLKKKLGVDEATAMQVLIDFRNYRVEMTGKKSGATGPRDWVRPPEKPKP